MPDLLAILGSNYFRTPCDALAAGPSARREGEIPVELAAGIERTIRGLQIPRGREQLIGRLAKKLLPPPRRGRDRETRRQGDKETRRQGEGGVPAPSTGSTDNWQLTTDNCDSTDNWQLTTDNCLRAARAVVGHLADALDGLPEHATLPEWARAWQRLAERLGLLRAAAGALPSGHEHAAADEDSLAATTSGRGGNRAGQPVARPGIRGTSAARSPAGIGRAGRHPGQPADCRRRRGMGPRPRAVGRRRPAASHPLLVRGRAVREIVPRAASAKIASIARPSGSG